MTLRIFAPNPLTVGEPGNVLVYSDNPGVVSLTYGAGLTGPASVTIPGTRVHELTQVLRGDGWECDTAGFGKDILDRTILFEVDLSLVTDDITALTGSNILLASNYGYRKNNWSVTAWNTGSTTTLRFAISLTDGANAIVYSDTTDRANNVHRFAFKLVGTTITLYDSQSAPTTVATGSVVSVNAAAILRNFACSKIGYYARVVSDEDINTWTAGGAHPALSAGDEYWAGAEESGDITYAESADANNGVLNQSATIPATRMHRDYTDTVPVVPYATIAVTATATTGTTIDATRPRQGVPSRASFSERIETAEQCVVTVNPAPSSEQDVAMLHIYADRDGLATITCDVPGILDFPAALYVNEGTNVVSGDIVGAGTINVTVELNGSTSVTPFTITGINESLSIGPDIDAGYEVLPTIVKMKVFSNYDDTIDLVSDNVDIVVPSSVNVIDGIAEVDILVNTESSGIITATNSNGLTASANVNVYYNPFLVKVGPSQTILRGDRDREVLLFVVSDTPGVVILASDDVNFEVPASVTVEDGTFYAIAECVAKGGCVATVTATKGIRSGACEVTVQQSANSNPVPTSGTSRSAIAGEEDGERNFNRLSLPEIEDIDWAVFDWLKTMDIFVEGSSEQGGFRQVPVIWVGTERAFQSKVYKDLRDISGSLNPPYITVSRKGISKDPNKKGQHWANVPAIYDYLQGVLPVRREIRQDKTQQFMNNYSKKKTGKINYKFDDEPTETKPVYEVSYVPIPVYLTFKYEIKIWTSYRSQMNTIEQKLLTYVPAGNINRFVLGHDGHYFEGFLDPEVSEEGNVDAVEKEERKFETTFSLEVLGHIAGEEKNQNSPFIAKRETWAETATDIDLVTK